MVTVLVGASTTDIDARADGEELWVSSDVFASLVGYDLKPEGACRDDVCVVMPEALIGSGEVDVAGFCDLLRRPVLHNVAGSVWLLAEGAMERSESLSSLQAPDFTLPDLEGTQHSLSEYRGKKVFLATWASW